MARFVPDRKNQQIPDRKNQQIPDCLGNIPSANIFDSDIVKFQLPSDLVVDRGASSVGGSLILGLPCTPSLWSHHLSEINISNINVLKVYH